MPGRDLLKLYVTYGLLVLGIVFVCIPMLRWTGAIILAIVVLIGAYANWKGRNRSDRNTTR